MSESNGELTELLCTQMAVNAPAELIVHKRVALVSVKPVCRFIYFYQGIIVFFIFVCFIRFPYDGMIVLVIHITVIKNKIKRQNKTDKLLKPKTLDGR